MPVGVVMMNWSQSSSEPVQINVTDAASLLSDISQRISEKQGFSVATLNLDHAVKLRSDPAFLAAYRAHTHVTADGRPIVGLSRLAGQPVSLVAGSELIEPLMQYAETAGVPVGFFGASEAALSGATDYLVAKYPGLKIAFAQSPPMGFDPTGQAADQAIRDIKASRAKLILLALGAPKQEIFAARAQSMVPDIGFLSIGAGLDFLAGTQNRAPLWVRCIAAEWIWRMLQSPKRMVPRYAACIAIMPRLTMRALRNKFEKGPTR